ncbi:nuclear transport factor 2 family protein [Mesorhizobium sp. IMUNJ 23033]|uniref:nuclear transport factor 2 family protein n=1 Tax=Mesorhizobium sp. IMUNJ 23033 TaxID=3378039 RepID=UPI00384AEEB7
MADVTPENQNSDLVRRGYAAFDAGDMETLTQTIDASCTWHSPGKSSLAGDYKGHEAIFGHFGRLGSETRGTFKSNLLHVTESEDGSVVAVHRDTAERNGKRLDVLSCIVFDIKNGKAMDGREYIYDLYAWDTFWA